MPDDTSTSQGGFTPEPLPTMPGGQLDPSAAPTTATWIPTWLATPVTMTPAEEREAIVKNQRAALRTQEVNNAKYALAAEGAGNWKGAADGWGAAKAAVAGIRDLIAHAPDLALDPLEILYNRGGRLVKAHALQREVAYHLLHFQDLALAESNYHGPVPPGPVTPPAEQTSPEGGSATGAPAPGEAIGTVWWLALASAAAYAVWRVFLRRS